MVGIGWCNGCTTCPNLLSSLLSYRPDLSPGAQVKVVIHPIDVVNKPGVCPQVFADQVWFCNNVGPTCSP